MSNLSKALMAAMDGVHRASDPRWGRDVLPIGIPPIDNSLCGGFAYGTIAELFGDWGVGKTLLLYSLLAANQRAGGTSILFESEGAFYPEFFENLGGDPSTLLLKPIRTVEEFFEGCYKLLKVMQAAKKKGRKDSCVIGWDSLAGTGTEHLVKTWEKGEKKQDMSKARRMSEGCALINNMVDETRCIIVATNQLRVNIGAAEWERPHTPGGKGWPFHSSQRIELNFDGGPVGSQIFHVEDGAKHHIGRKVRGEVIKNRVGPPFRKFKIPLYTEAGYPHPMWPNEETKLGIDVEESIFNWLSDKNNTFRVEDEEGNVTRKRYMTSAGPYWSFAPELAAAVGAAEDERFYKKDFKKVLSGLPQLRTANYMELVSKPKEAKKKRGRKKK